MQRTIPDEHRDRLIAVGYIRKVVRQRHRTCTDRAGNKTNRIWKISGFSRQPDRGLP
jgi:hypothetical protein